MNNSLRLTLLAFVALAGVANTVAAKQKPSADASRLEQTHFSSEEDPKRVVALPQEVSDLLMNDEIVIREKSCVKRTDEQRSSLFVASEIHLGESQQPDFVILGRSCLMGANIGPFWIVEKSPRGFHEILTWVSHDLDVLPTKTHGHHDLRLTSATSSTISTTICKFDGKKYASTKRDLKPSP